MSERPTDWSALGYSSDPVPGDPALVRADGQHYLDIASKLGRISGTLGSLSTGATTGSSSVASLVEGAEQVRSDADRARGRYQAAGDALVGYAYVHDAAQQTTLRALYAARAAQRDEADAQALARSRDRLAREAASAGDDEQARLWTRRAEASRRDAADARAQVGVQRRIADQAVADWDRAARDAISKIDAATGADGLDDSWWDDWGAKALKILADVAEWVSTIAGVLALLVCWIPVIGQALAAALLLIAAISAAVAAVANVVLAATGERSWTEAVISIVGTVLACVGLKTAFVAGKAAFNAIMRTGTRMAAKNGVADGAGKLMMAALMRPGALKRIAAGKTLAGIRGRIGEESVNIISNVGKRGFKAINPVTKKMRNVFPDGVVNWFGTKIFGECKNMGWDNANKVLKVTPQLRTYVDLATGEDDGLLRVFINDQMEADALVGAFHSAITNKSKVILIKFEQVLGTKINAWVQATVGTGVKAPLLGGDAG